MHAWFAGAFERCLELCDAVKRRDPETQTHLALLKARAMLRLDRANDALTVLASAAAIPCATDESIAIRMLTGAAHVRQGDLDRGILILLGAQLDGGGAHRTILSEISLNLALGHYARRDFDAAERALNAVGTDADIVYARALEYRGWIALARTQSERATTLFAQALDALDRCRQFDRFLEANCVRALAHIAVERLDPGTWSIVEARRSRIDWAASGLAQPQFWVAYCNATHALDIEGKPLEAARHARLADGLATTPAYRVQARCKRASVARYAAEPVSQRDHVESATHEFEAIGSAELRGDEATVPLILAEELAACGLVTKARVVLERYVRSSRSATLSATHARSTQGLQRFVEGTVLEAAGDPAARDCYRDAFEIFSRIGYTRRAVMSALRLSRLRADRRMDDYAAAATAHLPPQSWMRRDVAAAKAERIRLTAVQREVLVMICHGTSNPEIARRRKRSLHTIRNLVARLFEIFGVTSREELAVECVRRGLHLPQ